MCSLVEVPPRCPPAPERPCLPTIASPPPNPKLPMVASNGSGIPERVLSALSHAALAGSSFFSEGESDVTDGKSSAPPPPLEIRV